MTDSPRSTPPDLTASARLAAIDPATRAMLDDLRAFISSDYVTRLAEQTRTLANFARPRIDAALLGAMRGVRLPTVDLSWLHQDLLAAATLKTDLTRTLLGLDHLKGLMSYRHIIRQRVVEAQAMLEFVRPRLTAAVMDGIHAVIEGRTALHWYVARELNERGWWLVPTWELPLVMELGRVVTKRKGRRVIDSFLLERYRWSRHRRLSRMIRGWTEPEFEARRKVFSEAFTDYRAGRYRAVITALLPHVEGVIKDFVIAERALPSTHAGRTSTKTLVRAHLAAGSHAGLDGFVAMIELLFTDFVWGVTLGDATVARHPLAHGAALAPNSERQALKLFLLLETLHFFQADAKRRRRTQIV